MLEINQPVDYDHLTRAGGQIGAEMIQLCGAAVTLHDAFCSFLEILKCYQARLDNSALHHALVLLIV